jgi:phosphate starvation-inducible protein PhoH and related proteins
LKQPANGIVLAFAFDGANMIKRNVSACGNNGLKVYIRGTKRDRSGLAVSSTDSIQTSIHFTDNELARQLFGEQNSHLKKIAESTDVAIHARGTTVFVEGDEIAVPLVENLLNQLYELLKENYPIHPNDIDYAIRLLNGNDRIRLKEIFLDRVYLTSKKTAITPKSQAQKNYIDAIRSYDIVFGIGPAGTGKTYLAMAMAVAALSKGLVNRIILTRPAVEAGEALGFLPGDLAEKVDPYLRPLYDALHDMMRLEKASALMQKGVIEVAPLAFMRGRTLNESFVILDEAQNTTSEQMKMFLTRIGFSSKAVITGDITQIDLPPDKTSGLVEAKNILQSIEGIKFVFFTKIDVVRHRLVQDIIDAYEAHDASKKARKT